MSAVSLWWLKSHCIECCLSVGKCLSQECQSSNRHHRLECCKRGCGEPGRGGGGCGDLAGQAKEVRLFFYSYTHNAGPGWKRDQSKYTVDKPGQRQWQWSQGKEMRTLLRTVIMGKRSSQKKSEMIWSTCVSVVPPPPSTGGVGEGTFESLDFQVIMKQEQANPELSQRHRDLCRHCKEQGWKV